MRCTCTDACAPLGSCIIMILFTCYAQVQRMPPSSEFEHKHKPFSPLPPTEKMPTMQEMWTCAFPQPRPDLQCARLMLPPLPLLAARGCGLDAMTAVLLVVSFTWQARE